MVRRAYVLSGAARARFVISPTMPRLARGNYVFEAGDGDKVDLYRLERDLSGIPETVTMYRFRCYGGHAIRLTMVVTPCKGWGGPRRGAGYPSLDPSLARR
jgi:hypothetical protein